MLKRLARNKLLIGLLVGIVFGLLPMGTMGASWVQAVGLLPGTSVVISSDAPSTDIVMASLLSPFYGNRLGICDATNDEVEINAATVAVNAVGGGKVKLEGRTFIISATITMLSGVTLEGNGRGQWQDVTVPTMITLADNSDCNMVAIGEDVCAVTLRNFNLDGNSANQASGHGIYSTQPSDDLAKNVLLDGIRVNDCKQSCVYLNGGAEYDIRGCLFTNATNYGLYCGAIAIKASDCGIGGCATAIYIPSGCPSLSGTQANIFTNFEIQGEGVGSWGVWSLGARSIFSNFFISRTKGSGFRFDYDGGNGNNNVVDGCYIEGCGYDSGDDKFKSGIYNDGVVNTFTGCRIQSQGVNITKYGIYEDTNAAASYYANSYVGNNVKTTTVGAYFPNPTNSIIQSNLGYIHSGEIRTAAGVLTAGNANAIAFAWHNLETQDIYIKKLVVVVTTAGGTVGSHLDAGIADDAAGTNRGVEFFNDLLLNSVQVNDSWVAGDGGTQIKWVFCQDYASATDGWVVGQILDANAAALVGSWYIEYVGK